MIEGKKICTNTQKVWRQRITKSAQYVQPTLIYRSFPDSLRPVSTGSFPSDSRTGQRNVTLTLPTRVSGTERRVLGSFDVRTPRGPIGRDHGRQSHGPCLSTETPKVSDSLLNPTRKKVLLRGFVCRTGLGL